MLLALATIFAIIGAVCIYQNLPASNQAPTQSVDLQNANCPDKKDSCAADQQLDMWWDDSQKCYNNTCCPANPEKAKCESGFRFRRYLNADECWGSRCCPRGPKSKCASDEYEDKRFD